LAARDRRVALADLSAASCGAHHLARRLAALGHAVKLMPAQ
jgi:hypothetical protein